MLVIAAFFVAWALVAPDLVSLRLGKKADALAALRRRLWVTNAPRPESTSLSGTESSSSRHPAGNSAWTIGSKTPSRPSARGRSAPRYRRDRKAAFAREESRAPRIGGPTRCLADEERGSTNKEYGLVSAPCSSLLLVATSHCRRCSHFQVGTVCWSDSSRTFNPKVAGSIPARPISKPTARD